MLNPINRDIFSISFCKVRNGFSIQRNDIFISITLPLMAGAGRTKANAGLKPN